MAFSRTEKSRKIDAGPGKSWKSINSYNNVFFKNDFL